MYSVNRREQYSHVTEQLGNTSTTVASTATIPCARYTMGKVPNHQKQQDSFARLASYPHKPEVSLPSR